MSIRTLLLALLPVLLALSAGCTDTGNSGGGEPGEDLDFGETVDGEEEKEKGEHINLPPVAGLAEPEGPCYHNESIAFDAKASRDPEGSIVYYHFDWGDGNSSRHTLGPCGGEVFYYAYQLVGSFVVSLRVEDNRGLFSEPAWVNVTVRYRDIELGDSTWLRANDELDQGFTTNPGASNASVSVVMDSAWKSSEARMVLTGPGGKELVNETSALDERGPQEISYEFCRADRERDGKYAMAIRCESGVITVQWEIIVSY